MSAAPTAISAAALAFVLHDCAQRLQQPAAARLPRLCAGSPAPVLDVHCHNGPPPAWLHAGAKARPWRSPRIYGMPSACLLT